MTTRSTTDLATDSAESTDGASVRQTAGEVAANVRGAAETVAAHLPEAAAQTRAAVDEAARRIESGSDEMLTAGTTLSLGIAIGMLVGGAPRILVALALIPAAAMGLAILDRNSRSSTSKL
ncbi:MAG: hypothetical protein H0V87_02030 [Chloroflexi bacterium]|nr:hypothetical protein [Chloroflexota bacterium]